MKKYKKSLTINVAEDQSNQKLSPKHSKYKQNKQIPLLMFNQHTVASSANNQDEEMEMELRQEQTVCQEFNDFYSKNPFQNEKSQHSQTNNQITQNPKFQKYKKFNVVEFQQFNIEQDANKLNQLAIKNQLKLSINNQKSFSNNQKLQKGNKKLFSIQIPEEQKNQKLQNSLRFGFDIKSQNQDRKNKNSILKQPPAPSNKAKLSKSSNRHFVFPTNDQQKFEDNQKINRQIEIINLKNISEKDHNLKIKEINEQWNLKLQEANKKFQKQRQQFYKQKSNLQRDLMIKDGQIQMLQKLITNRYSPKEGIIVNNTGSQQLSGSERPQIYRSALNEKMKKSIHQSQQKVGSLQTILLQKDLQINTLLQKINDLNEYLDRKNNQLQQVKINLLKSQKLAQSLKNQIYLYQKKQQSQKLTKQFYKIKQTLNPVHQVHQIHQVHQSASNQVSKTPKGYSMNKWQTQLQKSKQKSIELDKKQYPLRGIDDLHKRLQSLKMNRIQLQNRGKIKSQIGYSQTSKNKTKGTFDFKGKFYDRDRDYINHSRMY